MNARRACAWIREQMLERALHRQVTSPERRAEENAHWEAAVAEVDEFLDPQPVEPMSAEETVDLWLAAGAELADA